MKTKLTLRLDDDLIARAKRYADRNGISVSQMVADYFALIEPAVPVPGAELTPRVRALLGALKGADLTEDDYHRHLEDKYL